VTDEIHGAVFHNTGGDARVSKLHDSIRDADHSDRKFDTLDPSSDPRNAPAIEFDTLG
jgi:hypothetical protein